MSPRFEYDNYIVVIVSVRKLRGGCAERSDPVHFDQILRRFELGVTSHEPSIEADRGGLRRAETFQPKSL